jgi:hypothetical protein
MDNGLRISRQVGVNLDNWAAMQLNAVSGNNCPR